MNTPTRKVLDRSFTGLGLLSIALVAIALLILLAPIAARGVGAYVFRGTVEHRRAMLELFGHGDRNTIEQEVGRAQAARQPIYDLMRGFEAQLARSGALRRQYEQPYADLKVQVRKLLGPFPGEPEPALKRDQYGERRWDKVGERLKLVVSAEQWDYSDPTKLGTKVLVPRVNEFKGTALEPLFTELPARLDAMLLPRWTFYWQFLFDPALDAHFFGGIWPELLGTLYLTLGAVLFALPMGILSAIYFAEYAPENWLVGILRSCVSTLAGVPSIVFGLFGLAFFINSMHVSESKSVLAGSLTLALLILPLIIRASEEALRAVPRTYKEAALSLGAGKWRTIVTVVLPAALPGVLTGLVISMGRAAGETAPIIFTAAVSAGSALYLWETLDHATPALPWNIYNIATEHEAANEIRHVQFGMVFTLVLLVLMLNAVAIVLRARISRRLSQ